MNARRIGTVAVVTGLALGLAGCDNSRGHSPNSSGAKIKIGIKFDQPGLGLKEGGKYTGFDVDVATYVAGKLGIKPANIQWVQAPTAQRETLISTGQVKLVVATYSITDAREEKVSFAGPYFVAGQDLLVRAGDTAITGPNSLKGKRLCSVTGSTSAENVAEKYPGVQLEEFGRYSECVAALLSDSVDVLTTDNTILAGYAAQPQYKGKLKVVGKTFSTERYGIGLKKGNTALCTQVTDAITSMEADGSWQRAVDNNLGPAGFTPGPGNPPKPVPCS